MVSTCGPHHLEDPLLKQALLAADGTPAGKVKRTIAKAKLDIKTPPKIDGPQFDFKAKVFIYWNNKVPFVCFKIKKSNQSNQNKSKLNKNKSKQKHYKIKGSRTKNQNSEHLMQTRLWQLSSIRFSAERPPHCQKSGGMSVPLQPKWQQLRKATHINIKSPSASIQPIIKHNKHTSKKSKQIKATIKTIKTNQKSKPNQIKSISISISISNHHQHQAILVATSLAKFHRSPDSTCFASSPRLRTPSTRPSWRRFSKWYWYASCQSFPASSKENVLFE